MNYFASQSLSRLASTLSLSFEQSPSSLHKVSIFLEHVPPELLVILRSALLTKTSSMRFEDILTSHENRISTTLDCDINMNFGFLPLVIDADKFLFEDEVTTPNPLSGQIPRAQLSWLPRYESNTFLRAQTGQAFNSRPCRSRYKTFFPQLPALPDPRTTLVFDVDVTCYYDKETKTVKHNKLLTSDLVWLPIGNQKDPPSLDPNIVIAELSENERVCKRLYAVKGTGFEHTKWAPVSTFYRPIEVDANAVGRYELVIESLDEKTNALYYLKQALDALSTEFDSLRKACFEGYTSLVK